MEGTTKGITERIHYQKRWWEGVNLELFDWNGSEGPVGLSPDCIESLANHDPDIKPHIIEL